MLKAILFVGGRLLAAGVAAIAAAFDVSGESVLGLDTDGIRIVAVVAGVVFVLLTLAREMQLALAPRPRLKFTSLAPATSDVVFRGTRTDASGATIGTQTQKVGHFVRFEFMNTAEAEGQQSVAGHLHARIRILEGKTQIGEWPGRWANTKHPESPEEIWELNRIDLGPNGEKVMLDIGVRYEGDPRFYAWHNAALIRGRFTPEQRWSGEEYVVEVELGANNMKRQTLRFKLRNPQEEKEAKLILLRRKGILRKWSEVSND